jgi:hypothetical protein
MKRPFRISRINEPDNSAWRMYRIRDTVQTGPEYQRSSDIWTKEKMQLLVDTILNGFDVPKLYFHKFPTPLVKDGHEYEYAIIDGKQRLEAIWGYIDGSFALADDFECLWDSSMQAAGMTYADLSKNFPDLKTAFDSYPLTIVTIETSDIEIIEDMFSRLNEAVPLSAAEKRNAKGGPIPVAVKSLTALSFFTTKLPFSNNRYRHFDLAAKFLLATEKKLIVDTKKRSLDKYVEDWAKKSNRDETLPFYAEAAAILADMSNVFTDKDKLLRQAGAVALYFHLFRTARAEGWTNEIERYKLEAFEAQRIANKTEAEAGREADISLLEFDRYAQSSNDAYAVKLRLQILLSKTFSRDIKVEDI